MTERDRAMRRRKAYIRQRLRYERKKRIYAIWCKFTLA